MLADPASAAAAPPSPGPEVLGTPPAGRRSSIGSQAVPPRPSFFEVTPDELDRWAETHELGRSGRALLSSLMAVRGLSGADAVVAALQAVEAEVTGADAPDWLGFGGPEREFELLEAIGQGCYGSVYKARERATGKLFAAKKVDLEDLEAPLLRNEFLAYLTLRASPQTLQLHRLVLAPTAAWLVLELCAASVLDLMVRLRFTLTEDEIGAVISYSLLGLETVHAAGLVHRDVKAANLLVCDDGAVKLADFGVAGLLEMDEEGKRKRLYDVAGSPHWLAPEVAAMDAGYDDKADVWSLGITAMEMATGEPPHAEVHPHRVILLADIQDAPRLDPEDGWSEDFVDFVAQCLVKDPTQRASVAALLVHPFVRERVKYIRATSAPKASRPRRRFLTPTPPRRGSQAWFSPPLGGQNENANPNPSLSASKARHQRARSSPLSALFSLRKRIGAPSPTMTGDEPTGRVSIFDDLEEEMPDASEEPKDALRMLLELAQHRRDLTAEDLQDDEDGEGDEGEEDDEGWSDEWDTEDEEEFVPEHGVPVLFDEVPETTRAPRPDTSPKQFGRYVQLLGLRLRRALRTKQGVGPLPPSSNQQRSPSPSPLRHHRPPSLPRHHRSPSLPRHRRSPSAPAERRRLSASPPRGRAPIASLRLSDSMSEVPLAVREEVNEEDESDEELQTLPSGRPSWPEQPMFHLTPTRMSASTSKRLSRRKGRPHLQRLSLDALSSPYGTLLSGSEGGTPRGRRSRKSLVREVGAPYYGMRLSPSGPGSVPRCLSERKASPSPPPSVGKC